MSQKRVIIEHILPQIDGGVFPIKRVVGDTVTVTCDLYGDGHDVVAGVVKYRAEGEKKWSEVPLEFLVNDQWTATFTVSKQGLYEYQLEGWVDYALNWQHNIERKIDDGQQVNVELLDGVQYLDKIAKKATATEKKILQSLIDLFKDEKQYAQAVKKAHSEALHDLFVKYATRDFVVTSPPLRIWVDREKAAFSTWYEFFPRSASRVEGQHGTFKDCEKLLPRIAEMGFDTLYFPPIHPIGESHRKGKNNAVTAKPGEPGSPWAVGSKLGGHKDIHPELGTLADFKKLVAAAKKQGIEIAMDLALQCAPEHPWVKEHPQWFKWRPDGSVQYAENPPKKYQDILPIYFETEDWKNLWDAILDIVLYWEKQGVRIFRVDNPHTKPFRFWEWMIAEARKVNPDLLFLSEAFTRPRIMEQLAKVGFTQSYSYYTWRNTKAELVEYLTELTQTERKEYFRANFWPNTPDINPWNLQGGHEPNFLTRYFMAGTLSSNYGMYGPVYEQMVHAAVPGKEEYWDSEKYEIRHWDWERQNKLTHIITLVNQARKNHPALQRTNNIRFLNVENEHLFAWFKQDATGQDNVLMVVNLDPYYTQSGWIQLPLDLLPMNAGERFVMHDLISQNAWVWEKEWNFVELNPHALPFHLFHIERKH